MSALAGRVVIVTRAEHQAAAFEALLQAEGATVYRYPCLAIAPPDNVGPLDDALRAALAGRFDWLALTSANAVDAVAQRLAALGAHPGALATLRVAAVGPSTAHTAEESLGVRVEMIPDTGFTALEMVAAFPDITGAHILLPMSALDNNEMVRALARRGAQVTGVTAYQPGMSRGGVDLPALLAQGAVDAITLTSGSTANNLVRRLQSEGGDIALLRNVCLACIGPSAAQVVERLGLVPNVTASEHTLAGLTQALAAYYAQRAGGSAGG
ncbi:MAG TPA: uroporphyrinogen-III synthase [Ktedonobacterales bacterium]|nr:uroporphyrinogen-III synthase [Ktedonobacterales bacterium]